MITINRSRRLWVAIMCIALGLLLMWKGKEVFTFIAYVIGGVVLTVGIVTLVSYSRSNKKSELDLAIGEIIVSVVLIVFAVFWSTVTLVCCAAFIMFCSVVQMIYVKRFFVSAPEFSVENFMRGLVTFVLGLLLLFAVTGIGGTESTSLLGVIGVGFGAYNLATIVNTDKQ